MTTSNTRVPLAWLNLVHDKRRLLVALAGIAFAVLLMFVELGFWNALLDSMVELIRRIRGELVILSKDKYSLTIQEPFPRHRLEQALAVDGVRGAYPIYLETRYSLWKNPEIKERDRPAFWPIRVLACDLRDPVLDIPEIARYRDRLKLPDTVLMDAKSKWLYGLRAADIQRELGGHAVRVVGTFDLGTDFGTDGNIFMSERNFARLFPGPSGASPLSQVEIGVIAVNAGADPAVVQQLLRQALPDDVVVLTRQEFVAQEQRFWQESTPIGFIFLLGLVMGFVVGVIICYQILSADVADHLPEYATLKAIGYSNRYLTAVVLQEAVLLGLLGFFPGWFCSFLLYTVLEGVTGLPMRLSLPRIAGVLLLTVGMCFVSGVIAMRRVQTADPAEVF